ncbi:hypothetical protein [Pseudophaeobacter sp.]|uniref:hypothetical protein n=1 Tax=Pseudophaeobacter sp. TaxID=1971739 RepID=UPI0032985BD4
MKLDQSALKELKGFVAIARKRELPFGMCFGKKPDECYFLAHKTRSPEKMGKEAKQEGGTPQFTFGLLTVEGNKFKFTLAGKVIPGFAKRAKKGFMNAGLSVKIIVLDPEGGLLEEDGDDGEEEDRTAGGSAADVKGETPPQAEVQAGDGADPAPAPLVEAPDAGADPLAEKWEKAAKAISENLGKLGAQEGVDLTAAQRIWGRLTELAAAGNYKDALKAIPQMAELLKAAKSAAVDRLKQAAKQAAQWEKSRATLAPLIAEVLAASPPQAKKIQAIWALAQAKAGETPPNYAVSLKTVGALANEIKQARKAIALAAATEGETVGGGGGRGDDAPPDQSSPSEGASAPDAPADEIAPDLSGDAAAKVQRISDEIAALRSGPVKAYTDILPEVGNTVPTAWEDVLKGAESVRAKAAEDLAAADLAKLDAALDALAKLGSVVKKATADKTSFQKALEIFDLRIVPLTGHHHAGTPEIAPEIKKITDIRAEAVDLSKADENAKATAKISGLEAQFVAIEALADDFAHFLALDPDRKALVDGTRGVSTNDPAIDDPTREIERLYDAAQADRAAGKFKEGVAKLDKIAEVYEATAKVRAFKKEYDNDRPIAKTWIDDFALEAAPARALLATKLTELNGIYTNADVATTNDYEKSLKVLGPFWVLRKFIENEFPIVTQYPTDLAAFEAKLAELKAHAGKDGIKADIDLMETDLAKAKAEAVSNKFSTAIGILAETKPSWPTYLASAVAYKAYSEKLAVVEPKITALKGNADAAALLADAGTLMTEAGMQALNRDFVKALATVTEAEKRAAAAKAQADAQGEVEGLYDEAKLDNLEKEWDAAFKVYTDIRDRVLAADTDGEFLVFLARAQLPAKEADDAQKAKKYDDARAYLDSAITNLRLGLSLVGSHQAYLVTHGALATQITAITADPPNTDVCLQPQIDAITAKVTEAEDLIKPEAYDYTGAEAKLAEVRSDLTKATADGETYKLIKAKLVVAQQALALIGAEPAANQAILGKTKTKITGLIAEVQAKLNAGDFPAALTLATEAALWREHLMDSGNLAGDISTLRNLLANEGPFYKDKIGGLSGAGKEAGVHLLAAAAGIFAKYEAARDAGTLETADSLLYGAKGKIEEVEAILKAAQPYGLAKTAAEAAMVPLRAATNAIVEAQIKALEARLTAATIDQREPTVRAQDYTASTREMKAIEEAAKALLPQAQAALTYEPVRASARAKLDTAKAHADVDAIDVQLTRLEEKYANLTGLADKQDYATAQAMAEEIIPAVDAAIKTADNHALLEKVNEVIGGDEDSAPWWPQVEAAKLSIKFVGSKENADVAKSYLDAANSEIAECEKSKSEAKKSKGHLLAALEACNTADEVISQYAFVMQEVERAKEKIIALEGHSDAGYITVQISELKKTLAQAEATAATGQNYDAMSADVKAVFEALIAYRDLCDAHKAYIELRAKPEVEPRLAQLEAHEHRYAIKPNIDELRKKLSEAQAKVEAHEPQAGIKLLEEARAIGTAAFVMAQMRKDVAPTEKDIQEILSRPNGTEELDAMIDNLEPEASRAVVKVAFKARFGCEISNFDSEKLKPGFEDLDNAQQGPNIVAFYKAMQDLPPEHTLGNDSLAQFAVIDVAGQGSYYQGDEKRVVMHEGDANVSSPYPFGNEEAIGSPDDAATDEERAELEACQPANDEPVTFFNWNTLHEVGHAVDDQQGFMSKRADQDAFGGWTEFGLDLSPVAEKFAKKFEYDQAYISEYMSNKTNIVPATKPDTEACSDVDWEARRIAVCAHVDMAREKKSPWASMTVAKKLAIGGIVYQESYPFRWTCYKLAARSKGITGYQFRAPGEWFSELYAAYHSGKLKENNPAIAWLEAL